MEVNIYLCTLSSKCFGLTRPSSGAMDVIIYLHIQHMVSLEKLGVGFEQCVCWWRVAVQHATSTHTPQDRHLTTPRTPYAVYVNKL